MEHAVLTMPALATETGEGTIALNVLASLVLLSLILLKEIWITMEPSTLRPLVSEPSGLLLEPSRNTLTSVLLKKLTLTWSALTRDYATVLLVNVFASMVTRVVHASVLFALTPVTVTEFAAT
jgi:hypothetical protein